MATEARGLVHTYYIPALHRAFGEAAVELGPLLRALWEKLRTAETVDHFDGVSAWLDPEAKPHLVVVRARQVEFLSEDEWLDEIARVLRPLAAAALHAA
jgi:hypothetical protein